jgi:hypothetical protein
MLGPGVTLVPVQSADPRARRRALLFLACFLPLLVPLAFGADALGEHLRELSKHDPATAARNLALILGIGGVALVVPLAALAASIFHTATLAHRAGRFPPPGARMVVAVRVLEGRAARGLARVHQVLALALAGCAAALGWLLWRALACLERTTIIV